MGRHHDDDRSGIADWAERLPDERDVDAHDDQCCDQNQQQPDRWIGASRDLGALPVLLTTTDELGRPQHG